ncbi:MAG TPA: molybdopterin converting factor subunit 1 [Candidatus Binatia bacterium]|nr:molybdopterin converting factor subunit 1 [Candidatus Binatia bacterium]
MKVHLRFFASLRERLGRGEMELTLPEGATIAALWECLCAENASLAEVGASLSFALNREYVDRDAVLRDGDEVALIPPVSGGSR